MFGIAAIGRGRSGLCQSGSIDESVSGFGSDVVVLAKSVRMSCGVLEAQAIVRVLRMERDQLVQDCELPFVRMVIPAVRWCRVVRDSFFGRTVMMSY